MPHVIEGTWEEVKKHEAEFVGHHVKLIIDAEIEDLAAGIPDPPDTIRDLDHLKELIREGLNSPVHKVTKESWDEIRRGVGNRSEPRIDDSYG
jgi:hypothetical protein